MDKPKVLVVGINPWIDNTGVNTLINFFSQWGKDKLAHIYTRQQLPNTKICDTFFRISETRLINSFRNWKTVTGEKVFNTVEGTDIRDEKKYYNYKRSDLLLFIRELVWKFGKWKTKELKAFLDDFDADVLFFPIYSSVYMCRLQNFIRKYTGKPCVLYISDDNFSYKPISKNPFSLISRFWLRQQEKKLFKSASKVLVIAPKQKEEYDRIFGIESEVLTKGIDFSDIHFEQKPLGNPVKLVYTGKLIIGRWLSLAAIARALGKINADGVKAELDIYTTDVLTEEQDKALNFGGCKVKGSLTLDEVQKVQKDADILVFVESLEKKYKNAARLSFSTKITDYLKNGKCVFAIGDKDIAPIDYFNRYDSAITASSYEEIGEKLEWLIENSEKISEYSRKAYECGKENHSKEKMDKVLFDAICGAVEV